jgi:hypothetical protein
MAANEHRATRSNRPALSPDRDKTCYSSGTGQIRNQSVCQKSTALLGSLAAHLERRDRITRISADALARLPISAIAHPRAKPRQRSASASPAQAGGVDGTGAVADLGRPLHHHSRHSPRRHRRRSRSQVHTPARAAIARRRSTQHTQHTQHPRPTPIEDMGAYELSEAFSTWWRTSYETRTNGQALDLANAWAVLVLSTYPAGEDATPPPEATT